MLLGFRPPDDDSFIFRQFAFFRYAFEISCRALRLSQRAAADGSPARYADIRSIHCQMPLIFSVDSATPLAIGAAFSPIFTSCFLRRFFFRQIFA